MCNCCWKYETKRWAKIEKINKALRNSYWMKKRQIIKLTIVIVKLACRPKLKKSLRICKLIFDVPSAMERWEPRLNLCFTACFIIFGCVDFGMPLFCRFSSWNEYLVNRFLQYCRSFFIFKLFPFFFTEFLCVRWVSPVEFGFLFIVLRSHVRVQYIFS